MQLFPSGLSRISHDVEPEAGRKRVRTRESETQHGIMTVVCACGMLKMRTKTRNNREKLSNVLVTLLPSSANARYTRTRQVSKIIAWLCACISEYKCVCVCCRDFDRNAVNKLCAYVNTFTVNFAHSRTKPCG